MLDAMLYPKLEVQLTNRRILGLGVALQIFSIEVGYLLLVIGLIFVDLQRLLIKNVLDDICLNLFMSCQRVEMFQSLLKSRKMVVNFKFPSSLGQLLQFAKEWEVLAGVLLLNIRHVNLCPA